jgi:hypothetical protein
MLERALRRPGDGGTADAADGTVDQPGVEVLMLAEASHLTASVSRPARRAPAGCAPPYRRGVGRHGQPVQRGAPPYELLGWGVFASVVAGVAVLWLDGSRRTAALVVAVGLLALAALALAVMSASSRPRRPPPP